MDHVERTGGRVLIDALVNNGVDRVFCVPGESYLAALDALQDTPSISVHVARNEGGAAYMADAFAKLTGRPGVCFVTRGPGATNASGGVHVAFQDSTPMVLLIGQVGRSDRDREAFQEVDYRRMYGQMAKWVAQIDDAARIPEYLNRAFATATAGRPGPVVLALPEDMLTDEVTVGDVPGWQSVPVHPGPDQVAAIVGALEAAERPMLVVGGGGWTDEARTSLAGFADAWQLPVAASFRCQDLIDNRHPSYVGMLGIGSSTDLVERVRTADLVIVLGARLGEITTNGYTVLEPPRPTQRLVHVHAGADELGRVYAADVAINASSPEMLAALAATAPAGVVAWAAATMQAHLAHLDRSTPNKVPGDLQLGDIFGWLSEHLPDDAVVCTGAGNYTGWVNRFIRFGAGRRLLAPTSGTMGYGTPGAVAAKLAEPDRTVMAVAGDGCFMMNGQELATAVQYRADIIVVVVNNSMLGTIRMHQEREYPDRVSATDLANPDFVALARAYGAHGELVTTTDEFESAFERAVAFDGSALIELRVDPEVLSTDLTLSDLRAVTHGS